MEDLKIDRKHPEISNPERCIGCTGGMRQKTCKNNTQTKSDYYSSLTSKVPVEA